MEIIEQLKKYPLLFLLGAFLLFVVAWFAFSAPAQEATVWTSNPNISEAHTQGVSPDFEPDGTNVSPATQSQLESLRLRVIKAPDDTTHIFRLARLLQDGHKPEEAARNYRHYLALHPNNYQAWLDMTQSYGQAQQWEEALTAINEMLGRYPDDPSALYNQGAVYANLERFEEAKTSFQKIIDQQKDPDVMILAKSTIERLPLN